MFDCAAATPSPGTTTGTQRSRSPPRHVADATHTSPVRVFTTTIDQVASALEHKDASAKHAIAHRFAAPTSNSFIASPRSRNDVEAHGAGRHRIRRRNRRGEVEVLSDEVVQR